jgi:hypothetical protein
MTGLHILFLWQKCLYTSLWFGLLVPDDSLSSSFNDCACGSSFTFQGTAVSVALGLHAESIID